MFSFLKRKKDPLKEKFKRAKRIRRAKNKSFWKKQAEGRKTERRILTFVDNDICPECGESVKLKQTTDDTCTTDNHYRCTKCSFEYHDWCDDEDFE